MACRVLQLSLGYMKQFDDDRDVDPVSSSVKVVIFADEVTASPNR